MLFTWHDNIDIKYVCFMSITYSILAYAFGIPGRPVILQCGKSILKGPEPLDWSVYNKDRLLLARGFFVNSTLANASYYDRLGEGRAELSPNASLTIHSYENRDDGDYYCSSRSRYVTATLRPFRMYILWTVDLRLIIVPILPIACKLQ